MALFIVSVPLMIIAVALAAIPLIVVSYSQRGSVAQTPASDPQVVSEESAGGGHWL
jgi:hypothetical protein